MQALLVKDLMIKHPVAIATGTELTRVVDTLVGHRITGLPVVDEQRHVVGFVSEHDCMRSLLVSSYHSEGSLMVEDLMHREPLTVEEDDSVVDIAALMIQQKPKIYPVVDEQGHLLGLLTRREVLRALAESRRA